MSALRRAAAALRRRRRVSGTLTAIPRFTPRGQQLGEGTGSQQTAEQVTLRGVAAALAQEFQLALGFDAFRYHTPALPARRIQDGRDHRLVIGIAADVAYETL